MSDKVQAALEARKKRLESTRSNDRVAAALEARKKRLESTRNDQTSVTSDLQKRYSSVVDSFNSATKNYSRSYGEKALSDTLDKYRADTIRVSDLRKDLELNRKNIGNDKAVDEMLSTLNSISDGYRSIFEDAKLGSQFKDEDEFQTAVREIKYSEKYRNKDYSEILADIVSLPEGEEKEWLSAHQYDILRFNDDFSEYSDMGSSAVNPSWEEAATPFSLFGWKPMGEGADIGNIVTFAEQNKEKAVADAMAAANGGGYDSEHTELVNLINVHMKDDEKAIYNYLIGKGEYDRANEYITQLSDVLRQRAAGHMVDQIEGSSMGMPLELMLSAVTGLENFGTGIKNLGAFVTGAEGAPTSVTQYAHSFASEDNSGAWKVVNDLAYTTGNMAPSILVGSVTLGAGGAITMGASSAGNAYSEMRKRGYDEWQSRGYGTLVGAAEAGLSYLLGGIGKLGGKLSGKAVSKLVSHFDNAIARTAISLGGNMISEGVEEAVQTVLEPAFKALVTGEEFDSPEWSEVFYSALLGALSAGVVEGVPTIAGEAASNYRAKRDYGDIQSELVAEGLESAEGSLSNNLAQKYQKELDSGKDLSGSQLKKLVEANEQQFAAEDVTAIQTAAENRLSSLGETGNVKAISAALAKQASGEKLTRAEKKNLRESKIGQRVSDELNPENIKSGKYTTAWTQNIGTNRINTKEYNSAETKEKVKYSSAASVGTVKDAIKLGDVAVSDKGEARVLSTGENVTIDKNDPIVRIDNVDGENIVVYNTTAGEVASSDIEYDNEDTAVVYEALARFGTSNKAIDIKTLNQFISGFVPGKGLSSSEYVSAIEDAYRYGVLGYSVNELASDKAISLLPSEQRKAAYKLGKQVGVNDASARQKTLSEVKKTGNKKKGKLFFDGIVSGRNLTEIQRASLKALGTVSDSLGIDIHIFESETNESGRRTGANGWYDPKDNSIHIDLYSGVDGKGMMLFTAAHELTHLIRKNAPEKFKAFADFLFEEYNKSGKSVEELIQTKRAFLEAKGRITSDMTEEQAYDLAYEEVVADSCEAMLVDSNAIETISKLKAQDKGLWQTIKDFIDRLVRRIRAAYKGLDPDSAEANYVRDMVDAAEKLQSLWSEALAEAAETSNLVEIDKEKGKYSDRDSSYMDAVNRGDMETAQRIVDEAAKEAGYKIKAYHGTNANFTVFDKNRVGKGNDQYGAGFYFASNPGVAELYGGKRYDTYLKIKKPISLISKAGDHGNPLYNARITQSQAYQILKRHPMMYDPNDSPLGDFYEEYWSGGAKEWMVKDLAKKYDSIGELDGDVILYRDYPNELHEAIRDVMGYDGIVVYFETDSFVDERNDYYYVAWFDDQMKSSDPVTYDDNGNIIPLSERFNAENNDIRYSDRYQSAEENPDILSMTAKVESGNFKANEKVFFGIVPDAIAQQIQQLTGIKVNGFKVAIEARQIEHILKDHGKQGLADKSMANPSHIAKMEYALNNPDDISRAGKTQAYTHMVNGRNRTVDTVLYEKNIGTKSYYVVQAVPDTKAKTLYIVTAFIGKEGYKKEAPQLINAKSLDATAKTGSVDTSTNIISHPDDSVNKKFSDRPTESLSNRAILANALESTANSEAERELLAKYKTQIDEYNAEEQKLHDLRRQIKDLSFAKGARDTKRLKELQLEANKSANRINIYDKRLLKLESAKNLKDVLEREKKRAYDRATLKGKEALAKYKEEAKQRIDNIIAENREKRTESIIRRKSSELRTKIKKFKESLERSLQRPTDNVYVPAGLVQSIIDVCSLIDTDTDLYKADGSLNKAQEKRNLTKEKLLALSDEYKKLGKDKDDLISSEFDEAISDYLDDIRQKFSGKSLADMEYEELVMFFDILKSINETLRDARKLIGRTDAQTIYEAADSIIAEQSKITKSRKKGKRNAAQRAKDSIIDLSLSPVRNVERMSGYNQDSELVKLFNDFEKGVRQKNFFAMNAYKAFEDLTTGQNSRVYDDAIYEEYGNRKYTDVNGRKFGISKMQMMQTILSYEREVANNMHHIEGSGFAFADMDMLRKGKLKEAVSEEYSHRIPAAIGLVEEFRNSLANDQWAQAYMEAARKFFNGTAKDAINETYLTLKHRIIARDKNYIPFEVDKNFVVREISAQNDIQQTINSYGMLKETKKGASQPLIITGLNNILDRHIEQVGNVYGLAVPVRNFNKVWNVRSIESDFGDPTVQAAIQRNWGLGGTKHITQTVQDLQGSRPNTQYDWYRKAKSGYIGATFLLNLSVVTKQIGSLYAATSMLKWRGFLRMLGNLAVTAFNYKKISTEVDKYTASAWMRRQGLSDAELYTLLTESKKPGLLKFFGKFPTVINPAKWITAMDSTVALSLWKYAKQDTAKRTGLKGEELLRATAEFYDAVIENTQSMTDVLHRPEIQKRSDVVSEAFGMFKTDLYQMAGQLQLSLGRYNANKNAENGKVLGRTMYAILRSAIWGQVMTTLFALLRYKVNPYRDEDDKDLTIWSWLKRQLFGFVGDIAGYVFPLGGSEFIGVIENIMYGESEDIVDSLALTAINDLYDAMIIIVSAVKDGEMPSAAQYEKLVVKALQVFGVPANNIKRIVDAITLHVKDIANGQFFSFEAGAERSAKEHMYGIVEELSEGNEDEADRRFEKAIAEKSESALKTALGNMYKEENVDRETAERMLSEYFDMSDDEIYWKLDEWNHSMVSEEDYNKYDDLESAVTTGKNLGDVIDGYVDNGVSLDTLRSKVKDIYTSGGLSTSAARGILTNYFDMTSDEAYWMVDGWDYVKENETRDGYGKYNDFVEAVKTGKNLKKVIADYTAYGVTKQTLASQITKEFKPKYVTMSKKDKAALKGYLLNAYELLGYERTEKAKDIDKWIE